MFLSNAALKRPIAISTLVLGFMVIGLFTLNRIGIDFFPKIDFPYVTIVTVYPGAGPQEVETLVSKKIEDSVSEVDAIKYVKSVSMENVSQVFIEFELGTNIDFASIDVREKVDLIKSDLPDDAKAPVVMKVDINAKPVMNLVLHGQRPIGELFDLADLTLRDRLSQIPGMATVDVIGGKRREIQIQVDVNRLASYGLTILDVLGAIGRENLDLPSGHITQSRIEYTIRFEGEFEHVKDIELVDIPIGNGKTIRLCDVAKIADSFEEQRIISRFNKKECVTLRMKKRADANTVTVVDEIYKRLEDLRKLLPKGVILEVANDDSAFVRYSVKDVLDNMAVGIALTIIILYLFLHNFRATLVAATVIPICLVSTLIPIYFAGFTLNTMTLMALALCVGVLVMNALVVLENIYRRLGKGDSPEKAAAKGTGEIALAVMGSASTNIVVFLPIAFMSGLIGQFFFEFGVTVVFATIISLFVSFTVTPILASKLCKKVDIQRKSKNPLSYFFLLWDLVYDALKNSYKVLVGKALARRWVVIIIALACFFASAQLTRYIGSDMITEADRSEATITVEMPPGTSLSRTTETVKNIETALEQIPEVTGTLATIGKIEGLFGKSTEGVHVAQLLVLLVDKNKREKNILEMIEQMRRVLSSVPAATIMVLQPSGIGGVEAPIQLEVTGPNLDRLEKLSEKIMTFANQIDGATDVDTTWRSGKPEVRIIPDRKKISDHGLSVTNFALMMRAYLEGIVGGQFRDRDEEYDIRVKLRDEDKKSVGAVDNMLITMPGAQALPVSHFAKIERAEGPTQILRKDKQRLVVISMDMAGRSLGDVANDLDQGIAKMDIVPGYSIHQAGRVEHMKDAFADIMMAFGLAIILTYLVLAALLESYIQPFSIMFSIPLSLIGVWISLYLTHETFNIFSMMAVVMLVGIVVNNAILIIDYTVVLRKRGHARTESIQRAASARLRPIIMTTLAAAFAMVPLAIAMGWGAETRSSMAIASIGGLLSSAALTLFVVPVIYTYLDDLEAGFSRLYKKLSPSKIE